MVDIYAPNDVTQRTELWSSIWKLLSVGHAGLLMGDFNACCDVTQSMSTHSLMDAPKLQFWVQLQDDVFQRDVWKWIKGHHRVLRTIR